ncbi:hypothetical protein NF865_07525 [Thermococcus aggregans]|uniref:Uncharacterized protein n=1 Tax=Thermococcus aggregans TaxID=110163 RepID=A0A9E7MWQ8_THEAG|nr:hypothetical protein [Thermococcus aggregans]USS40176.1 hypothetical protein NF865_07525 [Thermococcus aggregans]
MEKTTKAFLFLIFATPLWALIAMALEELESIYGKISPEILYFVYPTLAVALTTALFLWKMQISLSEFGILASISPLVASIALFAMIIIQDVRSNPHYSDDPGFFILLVFYVFPVLSFLLGAVFYYSIARLKEGAQ